MQRLRAPLRGPGSVFLVADSLTCESLQIPSQEICPHHLCAQSLLSHRPMAAVLNHAPLILLKPHLSALSSILRAYFLGVVQGLNSALRGWCQKPPGLSNSPHLRLNPPLLPWHFGNGRMVLSRAEGPRDHLSTAAHFVSRTLRSKEGPTLGQLVAKLG